MQNQGLAEQCAGGVDKTTLSLRSSSFSKWDQESVVNLPRKEKRKTLKKLKRKQMRRDAAEKERMEEEAQLNDPAEQRKVQSMEEADARALEKERMEHEQLEKLWLENQKKAIEEAQRKRQEEVEREEREKKETQEEAEESWEYLEEGPAEIIWQGNEIIVQKKRVRVQKGNSDEKITIEDSNRPISNPLPPQSAAFADHKKLASSNKGSMIFDGVEQQIPNFGTEQDKAHCPFHIKTGACRFGTRCSRAHFYPDKSCTLLMKNMYNGPGLTWEQDEGLEYTDEEVSQHYQEFYEDVHTEFLKFGEIVNFKVCRNGSAHLRGNVYVHYQSLDSAIAAYNTINGRFFAGKQITCDFIGVTRWKVAICGEYMKSRHRNCSHGSACNFLHCFRNPGDEYDWADWDNPPPRSWMVKMDALFGRLRNDDHNYWKQRAHESWQGHRHSGRRRRSSSSCRISRKHKEYERHSWSDDDSGAIHQRGNSDGGRYGSGDERDMNSDLDEGCAMTYHRHTNQKGLCDGRGWGGGGGKRQRDRESSEEDRSKTDHTYRKNNGKTCHRKRKSHHMEQTDEENNNNTRSPDSGGKMKRDWESSGEEIIKTDHTCRNNNGKTCHRKRKTHHREQTDEENSNNTRSPDSGGKMKRDSEGSEEGIIKTYYTYRKNNGKICHKKRQTHHREQIDEENNINTVSPDSGEKMKRYRESYVEGKIKTDHTYQKNNGKTCQRKRRTHHREQTNENSNNTRSSPDSSDIDLPGRKHTKSKSCTKIDSDHSQDNLCPRLKERVTLRRDSDKISSLNKKGKRRKASRKGRDQIKLPDMSQDKIKSSRRSRDCSESSGRHRDHGRVSRMHLDSKPTRRVRDGIRSQREDRDESYSPKISEHSSDTAKRGRDSSKTPKGICKENSDESPGRWQASNDSVSEFGPAI